MLVSLFGTRYLIIFFRQRGQGPRGEGLHGPEGPRVHDGDELVLAIAVGGERGVSGAAQLGWQSFKKVKIITAIFNFF